MRAGNSSPSRGLSSMSLSSPSRGGSKLPVCHMCGRQFGSASLEIHQRTCRERYERERGRPPPAAPADGADSFETFKDNLEPCPFCARTFLPDRLAVHLRSCAPAHGAESPRPDSATARASSPKPRGLSSPSRGGSKLPVCHMCGKQFGSASLEIHQRTCRERYERERGRPPPPTPADGADAFETFTENLEPCENCGRTFLPDRLIVHQRSCVRLRPPSVELPGSPKPSPSPGRPQSARRASPTAPAEAAPWAHKAVSSPLRPRGPASARASPGGGRSVARSPPPLAATAPAPAAARTRSPARRPVARSPARRSTKERLEELQELRDAGLVSADEFDAKRSAILASI